MSRCGLAVILAMCAALSGPTWANPVPMSSTTQWRHPAEPTRPRHLPAGPLSGGDQDLRAILWGGLPYAQRPDSPASQVKPLPEPPGSASLFLYALGTIGAWQISRSARRLNLSDVPAWLHTGGPDQLGHSVRFDPLDTRLQPAADLCLGLVADDRLLQRAPSRPPALRNSRQGFLSISTARGPPRQATAPAALCARCGAHSVA